MTISPFVHRCVIRSGDMAGSDNVVKVAPYQVEYAEKCAECGELLAEPAALLAHIYAELQEPEG